VLATAPALKAPPAATPEAILRSLLERHDPGADGHWVSTRRLIDEAAPYGVASTEVFRWLRVAARHGLLVRRINGRDAIWEWRLPDEPAPAA
jgi:hypothetical protein